MRAKQFYLCTLKEAPADAEVVSHQLMVRAGFIKRLAAGIYTHMPLGLRSLRKVEAIIREEMNAAGALELLMPAVQPAELWQESGRWVHYGPELLRIKDRHQRDFVIGPTHEEVVADLIRRDVKSYRQLPLNVYQIQTKFRDEIRPRFGLMRGREFVMKDAYSFDATEAAAHRTYETMYAAYTRIFTRLGLNFRAVAADTGSIGGTRSHEFHVVAETGEDAIAYCPQSDYAANVELAEALPVGYEGAQGAAQAVPNPQGPMQRVATPRVSACADVATTLELPLSRVVKTLVLKSPAGLVVVLLRGDHELNMIKLEKAVGMTGLAMASSEDITAAWGPEWAKAMGYFGPVGLPSGVDEGQIILADRSVAVMGDFACGANVADFHLTHVNWARDVPLPAVHDVRNVVEGDPSPCGKGPLTLCRGIEVGHVFYLGTKYSKALQAEFLDETGRPTVMEMGCYGIGVTRILGAAIEQNFDEKGMIWPLSIAPFEVVVCPIGYGKSDAVKQAAETLYQSLLALGVDVILDDRDERPGAMFADWELIGVPIRITIGERGLKDGKAEWQTRDGQKLGVQGVPNGQNEVAIDEVLAHIQAELQHRRAA